MKPWLEALKQHYTASLEKSFQQFRLGVSFFFLGVVGLYIATQVIEPSVAQELVLLLSLIVGGIGFVIAMLAHFRMLVGRILRFFSR